MYCEILTDGYDELVVPLLQRMSNLEELQLHIVTISDEKIIDGNDLKKNILNYMPQLNHFGFNILSHVPFDNLDYLPSNADIQKTLNDLIMSRIDFFPSISRGQCHIYSYPYKIPYYNYVTNNFPGGLFKHVYEVSLHDERPFEHEFFLRIAQSFPLMKKLTLYNKESQKNKQCYGSKRNDPDLSLVKYPHLTELYLDASHDDYVEQFFLDTKMSLSNNISLHISYESLQRVTNHFTREATRINCGKVAHLYMFGGFKGTKELKDYCPFVEIH